MKIIFMGTPNFAVPSLEALNEKYEVVLVVSQPAKPEGRKGILKNPPVALKALELGIQLFQPEHIKNEYEYFKNIKEIEILKNFNNIKLEDVKFSYTKDSAQIKIPEFYLEKGDKISIMGESGQGKTTIMNILAGLYPLNNGRLLIDNKEIKDVRLDLVFVSQEVDLFDLSVRDNLCLGKKIPEEKIIQLLDEAGLMNWYKELPNGLETMVGEKGIKLSAGQKQRLNLIRGILIDKELYFFDEPTSNLDILSEEKITNMIEKYLKDKTYVIVTHRQKLKSLCNKHYIFENHEMREETDVINILN